MVLVEGDPKARAKEMLRAAYKCDTVLGHSSSKFDVDVAETHLGIKPPSWERLDDSVFTRFLVDPHAPDLKLKNSCKRVLGMIPEARDEVYEWLYTHGHIAKPKTEHGEVKYPKNAGFFIAQAPGDLVGLYAIHDLVMSEALFDHDMRIVKRDGMLEAYRREQRVAPILLANERQGMRVDLPLLEKDKKLYDGALLKVEAWLRKTLKAPTDINWDSDAEVATYLRKSGQVKIFPQTEGGRDSVSKKNLGPEFFRDPDVYRAMVYRNTVAYVMTQNIIPWIKSAHESNGYAFTQWQQVRSDSEKGGGARSGRITCSKWANIIKDPTGGKNPDYVTADDERIRKKLNLPAIPLARKYCLPDDGHLFVHVDWNQQELRITAHFEEAQLAAKYREDPKADIHKYTTDLINGSSGQNYKRDVIKHVNLRQFYGGGAGGLVTHPMLRLDKVHKCKLGCQHQKERCPAYQNAAKIVKDWKEGLPGVVSLTKKLAGMYRRGEPIRTLGGRLYHCKPPIIAKKGSQKGRLITFEYTGLNYAVQPSAADHLKMLLILHDEMKGREGRLLGTVYDELNSSVPKGAAKKELEKIKKLMESIHLDVPYRADGDLRHNWQEKVQ